MKICIFGAGAIGGFIGAKLAAKGDADVTLVARGPHLVAMQAHGLTLKEKDRETSVRVAATDHPAELGAQDYVILALKAHSVPAVLDSMQPLLGPETAVVTAQNGVPWWYFYGIERPARGPAPRVGRPRRAHLGRDRAGARHRLRRLLAAGDRGAGRDPPRRRRPLPLGEPAGEKSERVLSLAQALVPAGMRAAVRPDIRNEIWVKLWGNLSFNPISALTGGTLAGDRRRRGHARRRARHDGRGARRSPRRSA